MYVSPHIVLMCICMFQVLRKFFMNSGVFMFQRDHASFNLRLNFVKETIQDGFLKKYIKDKNE